MESMILDHHNVLSVIHLTSGSVAGCSNVIVGLPFDTLKVKMQTYPKKYPNVFRTFRRTVTEEGIFRGLYAGYGPSLCANVGENAVLFLSYGLCQRVACWFLGVATPDHAGAIPNAVAGSCASIFSSLILCPTELIKCRLQVSRELYSSEMMTAGRIVRTIRKEEGFRGFFRGLKPTWAREIPGYFALFLGYEGSKRLLDHQETDSNPLKTLFCGGVGGLTYWSFVFPIDVVKSRIQVHGQRGSFLSVFKTILIQEGWKSMYKGVSPALLRSFPSTGALFLTFETTNSLLTSMYHHRRRQS